MEERARLASSVTVLGIFYNLLLSILKLLAGILGHSSAMLADAFHSLSDLLSDLVVLIGLKLACRPADKTHPYGHGKIETFVALLIGGLLLFVALGIAWNSFTLIQKILAGHVLPSPKKIALAMALISILIKEFLFHKTLKLAKKIDSSVLLANAWHHRSDALSSVAAFLGIAGAHFLGPKWIFLDPLAAIIVALLILKLSFSVMLRALNELLEASLRMEDNQAIEELIRKTKGVMDVHGLRTRRLGPTKAIEAHICVEPTLTVVQAHDIATAVENGIEKYYANDVHVAIHVEPYGYDQ